MWQEIGYALLGALFVYFAYFVHVHIKALRTMEFYRKQGATIVPGAKRFIIGNLPEFLYRELEADKSKFRVKVHYNWVLDYCLAGGKTDGFKPEEHPVAIVNVAGDIKVLIHEPQMV